MFVFIAGWLYLDISQCYSSMAGNGKRYPAAAVAHSACDEIIHKCIRFCVPSTHACHKVFYACLRFIQEHTVSVT